MTMMLIEPYVTSTTLALCVGKAASLFLAE